jgi:hypothetical protein
MSISPTPPRRLDPGHHHLMALRIEQHPLQLLEVRSDELEQARTRLRADLALRRGHGRFGACNQRRLQPATVLRRE